MLPDIFEYRTLTDYLQKVVEAKKAKRSTWSFHRWAKQLGLSSTATLTRVVNGQRVPGEKLTETFLQHFEFDEKRAHYFTLLVHLARASDDPQLYASLSAELDRVAGRRERFDSTQDDLEIDSGHRLALWGSGDMERLKALVEPAGFEPMPVLNGKPAVGLVAGDFVERTCGTYREFHLAIVVRPIGEVLFEPKLFLAYRSIPTESEPLTRCMFWLAESDTKDVILVEEESGWTAALGTGDDREFEMHMDSSLEGDAQAAEAETRVHVGSELKRTYRVNGRSGGVQRPYDEAHDRFEIFSGPIADMLKDIAFEPAQWNEQPEVTFFIRLIHAQITPEDPADAQCPKCGTITAVTESNREREVQVQGRGVMLPRNYYQCSNCEHGFYPRDERFRLLPTD